MTILNNNIMALLGEVDHASLYNKCQFISQKNGKCNSTQYRDKLCKQHHYLLIVGHGNGGSNK